VICELVVLILLFKVFSITLMKLLVRCSVECLYQSTPWLAHNFDARVIAPQQTVEGVFSFCPREQIKYKEMVTFEINGLSQQNVEFTGQGTELKVQLQRVVVWLLIYI